MLQVKNIRFRRGDLHFAADFELMRGKIYGVIGPSGAGKTSLGLAIAGLIPLDAGGLIWDGRQFSDAPPSKRPVGLMFQENNLFTHLDLVANLRLATDDEAQIDHWLARLGLSAQRHQRPQSLSGGQKARAAFGRTMILERPIRIFDEPFAAIGPAQRRNMQADLKALIRQGQDLAMVVAHNINDLQGWADQILWVGHEILPPIDADAFFAAPPAVARSYL